MDSLWKRSKTSGTGRDDWDQALLGEQPSIKPLSAKSEVAPQSELLPAVAGSKLLAPLAGVFMAIVVLAGVQMLPANLLPTVVPFDQGYERLGQTGLNLVATVSTGGQKIGDNFGQAGGDLLTQSKVLVGNLSLALQDAIYIAIDFLRSGYQLTTELVRYLFGRLAEQLKWLTNQLNSLIAQTETRLVSTGEATALAAGSLGENLVSWLKWPGQWLYSWWQQIVATWRSFLGGSAGESADFNPGDRANILEIKNNVRAILEILSNDGITALPTEGAVVVPSTGDAVTDAELKARIASMFSDQVSVNLDNSRQAGVVTPVFREGVGGNYIFLLTPVNN
ncbi:MAG: hypothetical protein A2114_02525 [Candidatus Vogelbacteria bacterium GWA1_51_14]|uniref:Uncharacterized protein n=1 Tax=Candidatus Vogelbacteria bacterium GWA1_51_14 TaxID=1802435 RepID=A0A1G2QC86_9BACT|nr:MAG: hypothetical protein A2114_02525 [Candidatus Vogelbacteria bacterium GWA1_51_14]